MIKIGDVIDERYRIVGRIAHGGMADVYEAFDIVLRHAVALKVMREDMMGDPKNIERFNHECQVASTLNNPNVVKWEGQGVVENRPYMANEYVEGRTLRDKLNISATHSLSASEACEVMLQLTSGMAYVHNHGIIHADIKPDNLFYLVDGSIKITDFGIASFKDELGQTIKDKNIISGTVYYCAPEVLMGKEPSVASDIYAMGVLFYEILTGRVPFDAPTAEEVAVKQIKSRFPEASKTLSSIPQSLDKIILKACKKRPEERYSSALMMHQAIEDAYKDDKNFKEKRSWIARFFGFK